MQHRGQAIVFSSSSDLAARIDDHSLEVDARECAGATERGPKGAPGMPEAGGCRFRRSSCGGVRAYAAHFDARMSGTGYGAVVLHVAPEAAVGGPLGLVRTGDWIELDVAARSSISRLLTASWPAVVLRGSAESVRQARGYARMYVDHVLQADQGADFDFLLGVTPELRPRRRL